MKLVDLSHEIEAGMTTYKGLPGPHICDYMTREEARALYADGAEFQIGRIELVGNTGTYLDTPFHRFADGEDLSDVGIERLAALDGVVIRTEGPAIDVAAFAGTDVAGRAVLVATGWSRHWRTDTYLTGHPFLTAAAADWLVEAGARLVGIDSHNIDDTSGTTRPVHTRLLGAGVTIVEHMRGLEQLPDAGFRFYATPPRIKGFGTFPVRAFAQIG